MTSTKMRGFTGGSGKIINWSTVDSFDGSYTSQTLGGHRPCPVCRSLDAKKIFEIDDFQFFSDSSVQPKRFDICNVVCRSCGTIYLNPCYSDFGRNTLFVEAGQSYGSTSAHTQEQIAWLHSHDLLRENTIVLDVGCYDGGFLSMLPANVYKFGVDIDASAIKRARLKHKDNKIQFFHGDFESFRYDQEAPNTITMLHVLEHLSRPVEALIKLRTISNDATKLVVEVPVLENGNTNDIHGFFTIQHTTHFSRTSLRNCLRVAGWQIEKETSTSDYNGFRVVASVSSDDAISNSIESAPNDWLAIQENLISWHRAIGEVEALVQSIPQYHRLVIWGGGAHTEYLYQLTSFFNSRKNQELIILDSDHIKHGKTWRGVGIYPPSIVNGVDWDSTGLLISSYGSQDHITYAARDLGVPDSKIFKLYKSVRYY